MIPKKAQITAPLGLLHDQALRGVSLQSVAIENTVASRENTAVNSDAQRQLHLFVIGEGQQKRQDT